MYRIIQTTDGKYAGTLITEELTKGLILSIKDFAFRIDMITITNGGIIILSNPNYIIHCVKDN